MGRRMSREGVRKVGDDEPIVLLRDLGTGAVEGADDVDVAAGAVTEGGDDGVDGVGGVVKVAAAAAAASGRVGALAVAVAIGASVGAFAGAAAVVAVDVFSVVVAVAAAASVVVATRGRRGASQDDDGAAEVEGVLKTLKRRGALRIRASRVGRKDGKESGRLNVAGRRRLVRNRREGC